MGVTSADISEATSDISKVYNSQNMAYNLYMNDTNKKTFSLTSKTAFTLAEVLIALTIIGVIAVMTIPNLVNSANDAEYCAGYKKALSVGSAAIEQQILDNKYTTLQTRQEASNQATVMQNFKNFSTYFNVSKQCFNNNNGECWDATGEKLYNSQPTASMLAFVDSSGMAWSLYANNENILLVDINGFKGPNHYGKDRWYFVPVTKDGVREATNGYNGEPVSLAPYNAIGDNAAGEVKDITSYQQQWCQHPPCKIRSCLLK